MSKVAKWILICSIIVSLLAGAAAIGVFGFLMPYERAVSCFTGERNVVMTLQEDGSTEIIWPLGVNAQQYLVELIDPATGAVTYSSYVTGKTSHIIPDLPQTKCTLRITTVSEYTFLFANKSRVRMGEDPIVITDDFIKPLITGVSGTPYPDTDQLTVSVQLQGDCTVRLYKLTPGETPAPTNSFTSNNLTISFGEQQQWPVPAYGESYTFAFDAYRQGEGYVYYGPMSQSVTVTREDLLGTNLILGSTDNGNNTYTLSWNETKGDYYEFQHRASEKQKWDTILKVEAQGERTYTTAALEPYSYREFRVVAKHTDGEQVAESEVVPVEMGAAIAYSTIWPIKDLEVYSDPLKTQNIGTVKKGTAFCILQVVDGMFRIRFEEDYGYIESDYCLINLPECLGDLCSYDITNSYASLFKIHEYPIPELTDTVIAGYEHVMIGDIDDEDRQYLVPLLYPVVSRLEKAAQAAKKAGYTLKIVDAYRPRKATQVMYDTVLEYAENNMVPPAVPPVEGGTTPTDPTTPPDTTIPSTPGETEQQMTFAQFMTKNGQYAMNYFVAKGTSRHNRGAAIDLTLENKNGEVPMQTAMHDLSWYSETAQNNAGAKTLAKFMKGAGFGGLVSEWWHFQDDEVLKKLDPPAMDAGVSPQCWMADENGWRYRKADGFYYVNCSKTIDGVKYQFDKKGYATPA